MALGVTPKDIVESNEFPLLAKHISWGRINLSEVAEVQNGFAFSSKYFTKGDGLPLIRIRDIDEVKTENYYSGKYTKEYLVHKGDILVGMDGDFNLAIWQGTTGLLNQRVCRIILMSKYYDRKFLTYCLPGFLKAINTKTSSVTVKHLSSNTVNDIPLPLPPLSEQHRIVARIEELFSSLDKGIESLKTTQQQLKVYRQAVLKWGFEGKLTNKNVKEGELPEGWKWLKLDDVVDEFVRGPFGGSLKKECFVPKGYKVYEQKNAIYQSTELGKYFINENKFKELIRFKVKPYDFIVSCSGTIGKLFMIPEKAPKGIINQALLIIRINRDLLLEKFFMHLFTSSFFQRLIIKDAKGTAMLNLAGVKDMKLVPVLLPPIREQQAIVAEIESRLSVCDKIEESIEQSLKQSESLRQSILKKAFEGKLVPQDPNDEPASKLLERIKAEKEKTESKKKKGRLS